MDPDSHLAHMDLALWGFWFFASHLLETQILPNESHLPEWLYRARGLLYVGYSNLL